MIYTFSVISLEICKTGVLLYFIMLLYIYVCDNLHKNPVERQFCLDNMTSNLKILTHADDGDVSVVCSNEA